MTLLAVERMGGRLSVPFERGADTLTLLFAAPVSPGQQAVAAYDFDEHCARFDQPARTLQPRYVVALRRDLDVATELVVDYEVRPPGQPPTPGSATLTLPAGSLTRTSFALGLGGGEGPFTRLTRVTMAPAASTGNVEDWLGLTTLLGNTAKLLWAVGWERDAFSSSMDRVRRESRVGEAGGFTLDALGYDLGVQRFPPLPYAFDPTTATVALYHLDDRPAPDAPEVTQVKNAMERHGGRPHPGTNVQKGGSPRAQSRAPGRFDTGFTFRHPAAVITVPDDVDFALGAGDSFTVECFVKADAGAADGHVLSKYADPADTTKKGWALSVGEFQRAIARNVRFLLSDGAARHELFVDETLQPDRFYHVAGVIDRATNQVRLYLEGELKAKRSIAGLGALTNAALVRIGATANAPFRGVVDEVRLSRAALSSFHPVLGESDDSYRLRLRVFARWMLPTPGHLLEALNEVVSEIGGDPAPFLLEERDATLVEGSLELAVVPVEIPPGRTVSDTGDRRAGEPETSGTAAAEATFDPVFLLVDPAPHRMQLATALRLRLLQELVAATGDPRPVQIVAAYDPQASDLRAVGRALVLQHPMGAGRLAAVANRASFSWVRHLRDEGLVYASVAPGDYIGINASGAVTTTTGFDLLVGETMTLQPEPDLGVTVDYAWRTIGCGAGHGRLPDRTDTRTITVTATAPGDLAVRLEVRRGGRSFTTTRVFRVGLDGLLDGQSIADDGALGIGEELAGRPDDEVVGPAHLPSYLVTLADGRAVFATLATRRMQRAVARRLRRLLDLLPAGPALQVSHAIASAAGLEDTGRSLTLQRSGTDPATLGALAHAAGFTYVRRAANQILALQRRDELATVTTDPLGVAEVPEGGAVGLRVHPRATPRGLAAGATAIWTANSGTDTLTELDGTSGQVRHTYKVGWEPVTLALDPSPAGRLYSGDQRGGTVTPIDVVNHNVQPGVDVNGQPVALAHHPVRKRLYAALEAGQLAELDTAGAPAVARTVALGGQPVALALTPNGAEVWMALANGTLEIVDTNAFAPPAVVALPAVPGGIAIDAATAYVTLPGQGQIVLVDAANHTVGAPIAVGTEPGPVALAGSSVLVADVAEGRLYLRNADGSADQDLHVGSVLSAVAAGANGVYVASRTTDQVRGSSDYVSLVDPTGTAELVAVWVLGSGLGERLTWALRLGAWTQAHLDSTTVPDAGLTAELAGPLLARAVYTLPNIPPPFTTPPFTFEIRLKDALEQDPNVVIRKDQYDLVMNVLNAFHPIGVEVITRRIRERVVEVRERLMEELPLYTFPDFRSRGPRPQPKGRAT
jgi:hypothetical protein